MSCIHILVTSIYVYCLYEICQCNREDIFVFSECNATLEWNLGNNSSELLVLIMNPNGSTIFQLGNNHCTNPNSSLVKCTVIEREQEVFVSIVIVNTTINDSGNYTAWIRKGFADRVPFEKRLTVIDKPKITVQGKPILYESLIVTCNISFIHECLTFRWKIKGTEVEYTSSDNASKLKFTNLTMTDNFIKLECQVGMEKCVDSRHAQQSCVSAESDTFIVLPYHGPKNIFLNLTDNNVYLKENESFVVKCYADCYPACNFRWESFYKIVENEELIVNRFESTMAGPYICIARNRETNTTGKSLPVYLHHQKEFIAATTIHTYSPMYDTDFIVATTSYSYNPSDDKGKHFTGLREELYWIGPVVLVLIFVILVTLWCIKTSRGNDHRGKHHPRADQADSDVLEANIWANSRALPWPPVERDVSRIRNRSDYPNLHRHFSFEKASKGVYNQIEEILPLKMLSHSSDMLNIQISNDLSSSQSTSDINKLPFNAEGYQKGSRLLNLFDRTNATKADHRTGTDIQALMPIQRSHDGPKLRVDPYYTIDENNLTAHDYSIDNIIEEASPEGGRRTEQHLYHYASSSDTCHAQTADVNATCESYLHPISDLAYPLKIGEVDDTGMNEFDQKYITVIDDFASPVEVCQIEKTDMTETDPAYITPING